MISGVTQWLTCGKSVDKWLFGEGEDETESSESDESLGSSERSDDYDDTSTDDENDDDTDDNEKKKNKKKSKQLQPNDSRYYGELYSWGYNFYGQCGIDNNKINNNSNNNDIKIKLNDNENDQRQQQEEEEKQYNDNILRLPKLIKEGLIVSMVACGDSHALAIIANEATVLSWGCNRWGQLGHGDQIVRRQPTPVSGLSQSIPVFVAAGTQHSLVISKFGELFSFGCGTYGRLGHGNEVPSFSPRPVATLVGKHIVSAAAGMMHSAAIDAQGGLYTWGWNRYGQLGLGSVKKHTLPTKNKDLERYQIIKVTCGKNHTLTLDNSGIVYSFGFNVCGQLGQNNYTDSVKPKRVELDLNPNDQVIDIVSGYFHSLLLTKKGCVYSFGYITDGALGLGGVVGHQSKPKMIPFSHFRHDDIDSINSYRDIYEDSSSSSSSGTSISGSSSSSNKSSNNRDVAISIAAGGWHSAIITSSGRLYSFGFGDSYRLGNNINEDQDMPCLVNGENWGTLREITDIEQLISKDLEETLSLQEKRKNRSKSPNTIAGITTNRNQQNSNNNTNNSNNNNISENIEELSPISAISPTLTTANNNNNNNNVNKFILNTRVVNVVIGSAFTLAVVNSAIIKQ